MFTLNRKNCVGSPTQLPLVFQMCVLCKTEKQDSFLQCCKETVVGLCALIVLKKILNI